MKSLCRAIVATVMLLAAPFAVAAEYEGDADGVWIIVDEVNITSYADGDYFEYLGKGYVALLEQVKAEGHILDYGVMSKFTGDDGDGDIIVWWSIKALGDMEKVYDRFEALSGEMFSGAEWADMFKDMEKIRKIRSTNIYREVTWTEKTSE